jgi:hypothetical protein
MQKYGTKHQKACRVRVYHGIVRAGVVDSVDLPSFQL